MPRRALLAAALAAALLAACGKPAHAPLPAQSTVLALGDSLTWGTGASGREAAWPARLAERTGWQLVNAGVPGDTSAGALERLPALLEEHQPRLVIVSLGGNDFLRAVPAAQTEAKLAAILAAVRAAGAAALLVAVPRPTALGAALGSLSDHGLYAKLAESERVPLLAGAWSEVLADQSLKSDPIHANDAGYQRFAERAHARLRELGWVAR